MTDDGHSNMKGHPSSSQDDFNHDYQASFTAKEIESGAAFYNYRRTDPQS
jgi:predicted dithiol-disulfide oxidoreductase (DUF899 family)